MSSRAVPQRKRASWHRVKYGETIQVPNEQMSNLRLNLEQVLQKRHDPVRRTGRSRSGGVDTGKGIAL